jgi:hypothetical protein
LCRRLGRELRLAGCGYEVQFAGTGVDGLQGDLVAESFQGAGVVPGAAADVCFPLVVVRAEVLVPGVGVGRRA